MMPSTSKQTQDPLAPGKDQEIKINNLKPDSNSEEYTCAKRKASADDVEMGPRNTSVEEIRAGKCKRKASPDRDTPTKRHRGSCEATDSTNPNNVSRDEVRNKGGKRKASSQPETPNKRHRAGSETNAATTNTSEPNRSLGEYIKSGQRNTSTGGKPSKHRQKDSELRQNGGTSFSEEEVPKVNTNRNDFETKYRQFTKIGEGGGGCVYAGVRLTDFLPVAIKHITDAAVTYEVMVKKIPLEVDLMQNFTDGPESVGKYAAVSLLDWYYLDNEVIIVMERPLASMTLSKYVSERKPSLNESEAKLLMSQLVKAAIEMHRKGVFHRDLKMANILVDVSSTLPRIRIIDFGCGAYVQKKPHRSFSGTYTLAPPEWFLHRKYRAVPTTVWQLGALAYRMLHGTLFSTSGFINQQLQLSTELSQDCQNFLRLCLAIDPKERGTLRQLRHHPWLIH
uniref:serine/threonine-protein kinase pim-2-like n=1 Tax=Scatophagus argus TaxID=75038 RepID=UPI001ED82CF0|nr:serine/threonine-protein kinase pim-2-like [Scatophagus argus]